MQAHEMISSEQESEVHAIIKNLAEQVSQDLHQIKGNGLLSGLAGHLLFLFNAHKFDENTVFETIFSEKLDQLQEQLDEQSFDFSNGLAGQAWLLEYLNQADVENYDGELLKDVDTLFNNILSFEGVWAGEIEMVLGLGGYAIYAAFRSQFTDQTELYSKIIASFASSATYFENGNITWSQPIDSIYRFEKEDKTKPEYNLGLAHGIPGIIAAILPALEITVLKEQVCQLLIGSCDWLLEHQNLSSTESACFSMCVGKGNTSRLGWCYGDLTIALTLARVGLALDKPNYIVRALDIARHAAKRDAQSASIKDAGICHGYFGLVTIFQLLNKLIPHPELQQAAKNWLQYGLNKYKEEGIESLYSYNIIEDAYSENFSFLMGYSGIGLVLLGVLTDEVDWADCLLMD